MAQTGRRGRPAGKKAGERPALALPSPAAVSSALHLFLAPGPVRPRAPNEDQAPLTPALSPNPPNKPVHVISPAASPRSPTLGKEGRDGLLRGRPDGLQTPKRAYDCRRTQPGSREGEGSASEGVKKEESRGGLQAGKRVALRKPRPGPAPRNTPAPAPAGPRPDPPRQALHWQLRMAGSTTMSVRPPGQRRVRTRTGLSGSRL